VGQDQGRRSIGRRDACGFTLLMASAFAEP
jgi:hypothetical protein